MSDALTDISRDEEREEILNKIYLTEQEFYKNMTRKKAEDLISLWQEYLRVSRGYWTATNSRKAFAKIGAYREYLATDEFPVDVFPPPLPGYVTYRAKGGHGGWMGICPDDLLTEIVMAMTGRDDAVNIVVTKEGIKIEGLTCERCPFVLKECHLAYIYYADGRKKERGLCKGFKKEDYDKRWQKYKELAEKGKNPIRG